MRLRSEIIRIAHENPDLRRHLLPLLMGKTSARDANKEFKDKLKKTEDLVKKLGDALASQSEKQKKNPENWGYVGNIQHVHEKLEDVLKFLIEAER